MTLPLWARALLAVDRAFEVARDTEKIVRDELFRMLTPPSQRTAMTIGIYDRNRRYLPGGRPDGLFDWEVRVLCDRRFPERGRILLGAAGGGRELEALTRMGYTVDAFEPAATLVEGARSVIRAPGGGRVLHGDYAALIEATSRGEGPLRELVGPYDAAILGWGSFSHVHTRAARRALLESLRALCPRGPVLVSFVLEAPPPAEGLQQFLRERVAPLFAPVDAEDVVFVAGAGFFVPFDRARLAAEARDAGYDVALYADQPHGYALLTPTATP